VHEDRFVLECPIHFRPLSVTGLHMISSYKHVVQCGPHIKPAAQYSCHTSLFGLACNVQKSQENSFGDYYIIIIIEILKFIYTFRLKQLTQNTVYSLCSLRHVSAHFYDHHQGSCRVYTFSLSV